MISFVDQSQQKHGSNKNQHFHSIYNHEFFELIQFYHLVEQVIPNEKSNLTFVILNECLQHSLQRVRRPLTRQIKIQKTYHQHIQKVFVSCTFINMKYLYLDRLQIHNVQFISYLNAPVLQTLSIQWNRISNCKSLQKVNLKNVNNIYFTQNSFNTFSLQRGLLLEKQIALRLESNIKFLTTMQDLSGLVKINTKFLSNLYIKGQTRIRQPILLKRFKQRFIRKDVLPFQRISILQKERFQDLE